MVSPASRRLRVDDAEFPAKRTWNQRARSLLVFQITHGQARLAAAPLRRSCRMQFVGLVAVDPERRIVK
jgi:hypothetical protein